VIWVLGIGLTIVVSLYLISPFLAKDVSPARSEEVSSYKAELRALEGSEDPVSAKKAIIQARLLKAAKAKPASLGAPSKRLPALICAGVIAMSGGIYAAIGSPAFEPELLQAVPPAPNSADPDFATLLPRFEARLAENPEDATGWQLYGRTLVLSGNAEAGLRAYQRSLELKDTPGIRKEYEAAKTFAAQMNRGPSAEDIAAMQNLSPEDRAAAIEGMVESLSARLEEDPSDVQGWVRLLRSRKVLGQTEAGEADIEKLRAALPDQADAIIVQSGW